jgi:hypothetical protein
MTVACPLILYPLLERKTAPAVFVFRNTEPREGGNMCTNGLSIIGLYKFLLFYNIGIVLLYPHEEECPPTCWFGCRISVRTRGDLTSAGASASAVIKMAVCLYE